MLFKQANSCNCYYRGARMKLLKAVTSGIDERKDKHGFPIAEAFPEYHNVCDEGDHKSSGQINFSKILVIRR